MLYKYRFHSLKVFLHKLSHCCNVKCTNTEFFYSVLNDTWLLKNKYFQYCLIFYMLPISKFQQRKHDSGSGWGEAGELPGRRAGGPVPGASWMKHESVRHQLTSYWLVALTFSYVKFRVTHQFHQFLRK